MQPGRSLAITFKAMVSLKCAFSDTDWTEIRHGSVFAREMIIVCK